MKSIEVAHNNNISFNSRIVFLSPKGFNKVLSKNCKNKNFDIICNYEILDNERSLYCGYRTNVKRGYTSGVKTCTAGICANKGKKAPVFWHIENTLANLENFHFLKSFFKGTNAIIIGAKNGYKFSGELFDLLAKNIHKNKIPTTVIKGTKSMEASLLYESKKDTLFVCLQDIYKKNCYVKSLDDLQKTCDIVKISEADSVEFYDIFPSNTFIQKLKKFFLNINL